MTMPDIATPKIPNCDHWTLTELLEHEKEVTGMFMSGHPLDHFHFEIQHYGITRLAEFNEIKDGPNASIPVNKVFRLAGLVVDAQHRTSRAGKQFGSFIIEDFTGRNEFMLWSEDYAKYSNYLEKGKNLFLSGSFRQRYNKSEFEFRVEKMMLLESIKLLLTKQVVLDIEAGGIDDKIIHFVEKNVKQFPGRSSLKINITEPKNNLRVSLFCPDNGFEMNDEMAAFLDANPSLGVQIVTV
jgi:DNA polymerase-3 subunit alpha